MQDFWPDSGFHALTRNDQGWLVPGEAYVRGLLGRPELSLVEESCRAEKALHRRLHDAPLRTVSAAELAGLLDEDARDNYRVFLDFRDALLAAGTLEAWLLQLFRGGDIRTPPLFIDQVVATVLRGLLDGSGDAFELRAAELLFRPQRITLEAERVLAGDQATLDLQHQTHGFGELGRLLASAKTPLKGLDLRVLSDEHAPGFWADAARPGAGQRHLLDLTHQISHDIGHGVKFQLVHARSGLKALAGVLEKWVRHLLGVQVAIQPVQRIDDPQWRWHVGLDAVSTALLNDLYEGREVEPERLRRLISLFRLDFADAAEMRRDVAGKAVYLGLSMNEQQVLRLKPQNLLLNLPLAASS
jgi:hypothetical protein